MARKRRSFGYFGLVPSDFTPSRKVNYEREDYQHKLSDEELQWLAEFNQAEYGGIFYRTDGRKDHDQAHEKGPFYSKKLRNEIEREQYKRRNDMYTRKRTNTGSPVPSSSDPDDNFHMGRGDIEDILISTIDLRALYPDADAQEALEKHAMEAHDEEEDIKKELKRIRSKQRKDRWKEKKKNGK